MRVKMKATMSGLRDGQEWPPAGACLDVPAAEGADLCAAGLAEVCEDRPAVEKAVEPTARVSKRTRS